MDFSWDDLRLFLDVARLGNPSRIRDVNRLAVGREDLVGDVRGGRDQFDLAVALQSLLDDFAVEPFDDNEPPVIHSATLTPPAISSLPASQSFSLNASDRAAFCSWTRRKAGLACRPKLRTVR